MTGLARRAIPGRRVELRGLESTPLLRAGALASPPGIIFFLILVALVVVVARVALKLAWKLAVLAVVVLAALWLLGAATL